MSIEKILVMSTGHISEAGMTATNDAINDGILVGWSRDEGAMVNVSVALEKIQERWSDAPIDLPASVSDAIKYAETAGCEWLMFDRDAEGVIPELKWFDW
jgi:hypothetical protein